MDDCRKDDRRGISGGIIVLGIGLFFLAINYEILPPIRDSWPLFLVIVGVALILNNVFNKKQSGPNTGGPRDDQR